MRKPDMSGNSPSIASAAGIDPSPEPTNTTGRHIVMFRPDGVEAGIKALRATGLKVVVSDAESPDVLKEEEIGDAEVLVFPTLGVAVVGAEAEQVLQLQNVAADSSGPLLSIKPEKIRYALPYAATAIREGNGAGNGNAISYDYLRGYRSAVVHLEQELTNSPVAVLPNVTFALTDESQSTWGLQATKASLSQQSGKGIKVAVLDTGFDFTQDPNGNITFHPDFPGRNFELKSFVTGAATAKDGHGHGTHCVGTACGPRLPPALPRYGVAFGCDIFVGKVLSDLGGGADGWIIAGIEWAIKNGCQIISMSLGSRKKPGDRFNEIYENVARRALDAGTLIIAAAGNESGRPGLINPVGGPADCPSIMAVAAIDSDFQLATFSNGGINPNGGEVDVAAPGVSIHSSFPMPTGHTRLSGTSMATPHVSGIAALYAQSNPQARGRDLWKQITSNAKQLPFAPQDVGAGLVQAP
jgi:subtilisin family serine protease